MRTVFSCFALNVPNGPALAAEAPVDQHRANEPPLRRATAAARMLRVGAGFAVLASCVPRIAAVGLVVLVLHSARDVMQTVREIICSDPLWDEMPVEYVAIRRMEVESVHQLDGRERFAGILRELAGCTVAVAR